MCGGRGGRLSASAPALDLRPSFSLLCQCMLRCSCRRDERRDGKRGRSVARRFDGQPPQGENSLYPHFMELWPRRAATASALAQGDNVFMLMRPEEV
ncbi:hypothetical protein EYF80_036015 [Liparis tanakae]|uniref:Uncharacterized protein n=1 Tax=Liparis tanakae TaxID=230148 RepID=A0A4Z2GJM1_9TELE|nr:hypothetical protein EYF80_036015 [Liparis tanakae]